VRYYTVSNSGPSIGGHAPPYGVAEPVLWLFCALGFSPLGYRP
jgi:hypothetical protein